MQLSAKELASLLNGSVEGDPEVKVSRPSKIEEGGEGTISFLGNLKYEEYAYSTTASILLVSRDFQPREALSSTLIRVDDVYSSISVLLNRFGGNSKPEAGISDLAFVHPTVESGKDITVGSFTVIESDAIIGDQTLIYSHVHIGKNVTIGKNAIIYPGVRIMHDCKIGDNCILQPNVVIGSDGFGFNPKQDGTYEKVNHVGNVILEENVEVGANTTIDRATMGSTVIRSGTKLDNLIQLGHNVVVGKNTVIAAQTGVAGSTRIGDHCRIGGQVGFVGHISVADKTQIQAQSGIASTIEEPGQALFGSPAIEYKNYIRSYAVFKQLPELYRRINQLEKQLNELKDKKSSDIE